MVAILLPTRNECGLNEVILMVDFDWKIWTKRDFSCRGGRIGEKVLSKVAKLDNWLKLFKFFGTT